MNGNDRTPQIEFWFDFASTYSYLSAMRIETQAANRGVRVQWRPFLLGPVFAAQGWNTSPFNIYPAKGAYMWRDMARLCARYHLPLTKPDPFPQHSLLAARVALAIPDDRQLPGFCKAVFAAEFAEGLDISDVQVLQTCLCAAGAPPDLLETAQTPGIKSALRAQVEEAMQRGIFGAPSFVLGDELYWGDDRLDDALDRLA
ncbi:MAG: 2-hydroxychromene-2-carboxylate isomerase [Pseudomonadota bacterium]